MTLYCLWKRLNIATNDPQTKGLWAKQAGSLSPSPNVNDPISIWFFYHFLPPPLPKQVLPVANYFRFPQHYPPFDHPCFINPHVLFRQRPFELLEDELRQPSRFLRIHSHPDNSLSIMCAANYITPTASIVA